MASTDLPIRTPRPIPGPIAASPITRPLPIVLRPGVISAACAMRWTIDASLSSVLLCQRATDVRAGEDGEDECLQPRDEDLEAHQRDREGERERGEDPRLRAVLEEEDRAQEEDRQQEVPGDEVGGETDRQRDRPDDDVGDELDHHQEGVPEQRGSLADDARVLQVAEEAVLRDADPVVGDPGDDRQRERERDTTVRGEAEPRDHLEEVPDEDEEEEGCEEREEPVGVLAENRDRDLLADERQAELHHRLQLAGNDRRRAERQIEEQEHEREREDHEERDEVEAELEPEDLDPAAPATVDEVLRAGCLERCCEERDVQRPVPWNDHISAWRRPESVRASTTSNPIVAGTRAKAKATGESQARVFRSTSAIVNTISRTTKPPIATAYRIIGEMWAAHATESAFATKFAVTITTAIAADHAAPLPPNI